MIQDVVCVVEMQAASKNISIKQSLPDRGLFIDRQRVQQVCMNLLSNACKFTADGDIEVTAWTLSVDEVQEMIRREALKSDEGNNN